MIESLVLSENKSIREVSKRRTELEAQEAVIAAQLRGRVSDLQIVAHDQGVILLGRASSFYAKQLAQHAVMNTCRLHIVANEIEVEPY